MAVHEPLPLPSLLVFCPHQDYLTLKYHYNTIIMINSHKRSHPQVYNMQHIPYYEQGCWVCPLPKTR